MKVRWHDLHELSEIVEHVDLHTLGKKVASWDCFILVTSPSTLLSVAKEMHPFLCESPFEVTITKNALALLLTGPVGNLQHETALHWALNDLWLDDIKSP